jgi:hypothetical protein
MHRGLQRLCQHLISKKFLLKQQVNNLSDFCFRANCMNGHRASCILRVSWRLNGTIAQAGARADTVPLPRKNADRRGYKTFQKPRVQLKNR